MLKDRGEGAKNRHREMNGWECLHKIASKLISSGYGAGVLLSAVFIGVVVAVFGGMDSSDKKAALLAILGWPIFGISGWIVAILAILFAKKLLDFQERSYEQQLSRERETKNQALAFQPTLRLDNEANQREQK